MQSPLFSIIIPTYNSANTIKAAVDSILSQTYGNFELLILDGLSKDDTLAAVRSYNDDRIRIISEKDSGVYDAMNKGIQVAKGEWLYFLGSDDELFDKDVLTDVAEFLLKTPAADVVYGDALFKNSKIRHYGSTSLERLLFENNICHQAIFYNRAVFGKIGKYNLNYNLYADWDLNIRCFMHPDFNIQYIDRLISVYNEDSGISARHIDTDINFSKILPIYRIRTLLKEQETYFLQSGEFQLGRKIIVPFRRLKNAVKRIVRKK